MAKVKNIGRQPMGFYDDKNQSVVVPPGGEAEILMTEAYFAKLEASLAKCNPKPYELSGSPGGKPPKETKHPEKQPEAKKG